MRVLINGVAYPLPDAYRLCDRKLKCKGQHGTEWETIDFEEEHDPYRPDFTPEKSGP